MLTCLPFAGAVDWEQGEEVAAVVVASDQMQQSLAAEVAFLLSVEVVD